MLTSRLDPAAGRSRPCWRESARRNRDFIGVPCYVRGLLFGGPLGAGLFVPPDHLGDLLGVPAENGSGSKLSLFPPEFRVPQLVPYARLPSVGRRGA